MRKIQANKKKLQIGVIGSAGPEEYSYRQPQSKMFKVAERIGFTLANRDCIVVNGGKGGVMEAVSKGAKQGGGITVAEVFGANRNVANQFTDVEIVTCDLGYRGPSQLVGMSDAVIAIGGGAGTLQEICVAYRMKKPIILLLGFGGWVDRLASRKFLDERRLIEFRNVKTVDEAVSLAISLVK